MGKRSTGSGMMLRVLFLCTGNYYRSRFAEYYFRNSVARLNFPWEADSRGLSPSPLNAGLLSRHTLQECERLAIATEPMRAPRVLSVQDLEWASHIVAVKETEHRPLMKLLFPDWEERVEYWDVHDLDCAEPVEMFPQLKTQVDHLIERLRINGNTYS